MFVARVASSRLGGAFRRPLMLTMTVAVLLASALANSQVELTENAPVEVVENGRQSGSVSPLLTEALHPVRSDAGWRVQLPAQLQLATPAVADGLVFIGGGFGSHEFYAFDAATGAPRWAVTVSDDGPTAAVVENGLVAFNTESCTLFMLQAQTGGHVWSAWLGDPLMSTPAMRDGKVYMVYPTPATHRLAAFDARSGATLWEADVDTDAITAPILVETDVYVASMAGRVYRFDATTGALHWVREERLTSAPWVRGEQIFAALHDETEGDAAPVEGLGYLSRDRGARAQSPGESWSRASAPWLSREVQDRSSYGSGNVQADDAVGFKLLAPKSPTGVHPKQDDFPWEGGPHPQVETPMGSPGGAPAMARVEEAAANLGQSSVTGLWGYQGSRPIVIGDTMYATVGDNVQAVHAETGEVRWTHALNGNVEDVGGHLGTPPAFAGGHLWVGTTTGHVVALDPATGHEVWRAAVGSPVRAQPAIVDGRVYVGTTDGQLVMLDSGLRGEGDWPMWGGNASHQLQ